MFLFLLINSYHGDTRGGFAENLMQYSVLKDTILSMVVNLDAVEQYIIRQDDDEDEAVED